MYNVQWYMLVHNRILTWCRFLILFPDLKVQAGLMTETELKRIEFLMRVMSSHQVAFYLFTRMLVQSVTMVMVTVTRIA